MENAIMHCLLDKLRDDSVLSNNQQKNVKALIRIAGKFNLYANIPMSRKIQVSEKLFILESGHQPNFLPHAGTWKKAFLLNYLQKILMENGVESVTFFGFPDQNLSTAKYLSRNQVPSLNKKGVEPIGFRINSSDRLKSFNTIEKPSADIWQHEINTIEKFYSDISNKFPNKKNSSKKNLDQITEIMWNSYDFAKNFAELNGYVFAKICYEILNIDVLFFFYSDIHKEKIFIEESKKILQNVQSFNRIYNRVIIEKRLNIPPVNESHIPFWYHCECGGKINLFFNESGSCRGTCPVCKKEYHLFFDADFKNFHEYYDKMDFNAVSRNIVMAEGLGDKVFLSGVGGSLQYGAIADQISRELKFHHPISLAWQSKDYYLGMTHAIALRELKKIFLLSSRGFFDSPLNEIIRKHTDILSQNLSKARMNNEDLDSINSFTGMINHAKNWPIITKNIFSNINSFLDIFVNYESGAIVDLWKYGLDNAEITNNRSPFIIKAGINYNNDLIDDVKTEELPRLYQKIQGLEVK